MYRLIPRLNILVVFAMTSVGWADDAAIRSSNGQQIDFALQVQPIFLKHCYACHGPDEQNAGLRLDRKAAAMRGGESGLAFEPGKSVSSRLIAYVSGTDPDIVMPPEGPQLNKDEVTVLRAWIDQGAPWPDDADGPWAAARSHWAFQPIIRPQLPEVNDITWQRNPIDAFILAKLERARVAPAPVADHATLIRRLYLDLLGVLPSPEDVELFLADDGAADNRPAAYERLVDRLLASPKFGERWGRHWLDLARYADSDGYEDDRYRPDAWRFRDWVIAAINRDLPFDQFTIAQVAGDLIPGAGFEQKVAVGFHRMTLFNRAGVGRNDEEFRVKTAKDRASTTSTIWLGLTLGCAECHSHKYDPIPQRDYYRFYAYFDNLADTKIPAPSLPQGYHDAYKQALRQFEESQGKAKSALAKYEQDVLPVRQANWEKTVDLTGVPSHIATLLRMKRPRRDDNQAQQISSYFRSIDEEYHRLDAAVLKGDQIPNNRPQPPSAVALSIEEASQQRETHVQLRGDFRSPGEQVQAGTPTFLPPPESNGVTSRYELARWLVAPDNPLTSRVAVNHQWKHLFGRGLVATPENFGVQGAPPSHSELLDWLASELVDSGWSRKRLIRLIVMSATYRQSSRYRQELAESDPENRLLARQNRFRLEAETVRDVGLAASGLLNDKLGGPSVQPSLPLSLLQKEELKTERFMPPSEGAERYRRGVYVNVQRTFAYPMMKAFDSADANVACTGRERSNTPLQALMLLNDPVFTEFAQALGVKVLRECRAGGDARIAYAFRLCLGRQPNENEARMLDEVYDIHRSLYAADVQLATKLLANVPLPNGTDLAEAASWLAVARTLLNLDEFITRE